MSTAQATRTDRNNGISFSKAPRIKIDIPTNLPDGDIPYDPLLRFNKAQWPARKPSNTPIYSIDAMRILKSMEQDGVSKLLKISLAAARSNLGAAIWDVMFNFGNNTGIVYCLFVVDDQFNPISKNRIVTSTSFQDHGYSKVKTHLNHVKPEDKIGIGIYDVASQKTHVLIYNVGGESVVRNPDSVTKNGPRIISAINCDLISVYRFDRNGNGNIQRYDEQGEDYHPAEFVQRIVTSVMDFGVAYPWKPHFTPLSVSSWDRDLIETSLKDVIADNQDIGTYEDFEDGCREIYQECLNLKTSYLNDNNIDAARAVKLPTVQALTLGTDSIIAIVNNGNDDSKKVFRFSQESLQTKGGAEFHLSNKDLENTIIDENTDVLMIQEESFGDSGLVRFFQANY